MLKAVEAANESGSQKVQHHFGGFKHKSETISITKMVNSENSSDLERVAATRSIAVEFSEFTILVIELQRCENTAFHFHAAPFGIRTLRHGVGHSDTQSNQTQLCETQTNDTAENTKHDVNMKRPKRLAAIFAVYARTRSELCAAEVNLNVHVRRRRELSAPDAWMRICACGSCELHACGAVISTGPKS